MTSSQASVPIWCQPFWLRDTDMNEMWYHGRKLSISSTAAEPSSTFCPVLIRARASDAPPEDEGGTGACGAGSELLIVFRTPFPRRSPVAAPAKEVPTQLWAR